MTRVSIDRSRSRRPLTAVAVLLLASTLTTRAFAPTSLFDGTTKPAQRRTAATQRFLYVDPDEGNGPKVPRTLERDRDEDKDRQQPEHFPKSSQDHDHDNASPVDGINNLVLDRPSRVKDPEGNVIEGIVAGQDEVNEEDRYLEMISSEIALKKFLGENTKSPIDIPFGIIAGRALDTMEDIVNIIRRKPFDYGWISPDDLAKYKQKTVVVLGSGWAAHALIKAADTYSINMIVVSPVNHFVFTPMLASAAVGSVEYRSMTEAVRASNPMVQFIEGMAVDVDVEGRKVKIQPNSLLTDLDNENANGRTPEPFEIEYDAMVVSVGTRVRKSTVPGADKYCYYLKTCDDARRLRKAIGESLEYASRPDVAPKEKSTLAKNIHNDSRDTERRRRLRFCIVGGGPTGVELAGELCDFFKDISHPYKGTFPLLKDDIEVMLVHGGGTLVSAFNKELRQHALESLEKRGVSVRLNTYTTEVGDGFVSLKDKYTGIEEHVPVGITVWAAGIEPVPFSEKMLSQLPENARGLGGRINVDKWMRPPMPKEELMGSVLVLGDAAAFVDPESVDSIKQSYLPQTAQVAGQQGAYMARMLNRGYNLTTTPPILPSREEASISDFLRTWLRLRGIEQAAGFNFLNLGMLAYVGGGNALSQIQIGDVPLFAYVGSTGFMLWRSVYLVKQVATRNRVLVTFDWLKTALFGRDVTRL